MNDEELELVLDELGAVLPGPAASEDRLAAYEGILPPLLLNLWRSVGFAGFYKGRLWLCDPVVWQPAVDAWTANLNLAMGPDRYHAITRNAFGSVDLWGERTGASLTIEPVHGMIFPNAANADEMETEFDRNLQIEALLIGPSSAKEDLLGSDEKPLFARALKAHGPVGPDTMYSFVPAYHLGGPLTVDHIEIADAATHVELLASLSPHRVMGDITL